MGKVVASGNPGFEKGDIVAGFLNWGEYTVVKAGGMLNKLNPMGFPLSYHVGVLGKPQLIFVIISYISNNTIMSD